MIQASSSKKDPLSKATRYDIVCIQPTKRSAPNLTIPEEETMNQDEPKIVAFHVGSISLETYGSPPHTMHRKNCKIIYRPACRCVIPLLFILCATKQSTLQSRSPKEYLKSFIFPRYILPCETTQHISSGSDSRLASSLKSSLAIHNSSI